MAAPNTITRAALLLGVPLTGLAWSLGSWLAAIDQIAALRVGLVQSLIYVAIGGIAQTLAFWLGFSAVLWAMFRITTGGRLPLTQILALVSSAAPPLWIAAPAAAIVVGADTLNGPLLVAITAVAVLGTGGFIVLLVRQLAVAAEKTRARAALAVAATFVFLASLVTLVT
jgi:hypothetical protein